MMRRLVVGLLVVSAISCSVLGRQDAKKPAGTHYSAAYINSGKLYIFPFDGAQAEINLPTGLGDPSFSVSGKVIYGIVGPSAGATPPLAAVTIRPISVTPFPGSAALNYINSVAVGPDGGKAVVSATYERAGRLECGLFVLETANGTVEHIVDSPGGGCYDFVSSWHQLSVSPDGLRVVGTMGKARLGVVNLNEHKIERVLTGTAAWWSPDGKWIAALSYTTPMQIELIRASDLAVERRLGSDTAGRLQWSPDSRYLLVLANGACGLGLGYSGTFQMLDIETGHRMSINSSKCRVNRMTTGWVSDDVF